YGANSGGRGYVDLSKEAVDHIDADEQQSAISQSWPDPFTNLSLAFRQLSGSGHTASDHVGAQIVRRRYPVYCSGIFPIDKNDALVAIFDVGQKLLYDPLLAEGCGKHVKQRAEIEILARNSEYGLATFAVERLHNNVTVSGSKRLDLGKVARDQRWRHQIRKLGDEHFLWSIAYAGGGVDDKGPGMDALQKMGRCGIGQVEWWVLAQQHHVELGEFGAPRLAQSEMVA